MTQERKDELYDQMIAWICEHIPNDEDLFLTLHGHFGMTKDELHDHSLISSRSCNALSMNMNRPKPSTRICSIRLLKRPS